MFHLVSLSLQISLTDLPGPCLGLCVGVACFVACLGGFVVGFFLKGKFDLNHMLIPVVDRPCLALVRQCRKKKNKIHPRKSWEKGQHMEEPGKSISKKSRPSRESAALLLPRLLCLTSPLRRLFLPEAYLSRFAPGWHSPHCPIFSSGQSFKHLSQTSGRCTLRNDRLDFSFAP